MSNSGLVNYVRLSPNHSGRRQSRITKITPHHMAGNLSVEQCGNVFANASRQASSNYGIGTDGRVGLYVEEHNHAWTSSNWWNDDCAVTIEVANDQIGGNWHVSDAAYNKLVDLCVDICQRNGIAGLSWTGNANGSLTCHYMFAPTGCPGPYLKGRMADLAARVNARLGGGSVAPVVSSGGNPLGQVNVLYALKYESTWLDTVWNFNNANSEGFTGMPFGQHFGFWAKVDKGNIKYKLHTPSGGWTDYAADGQEINTSDYIDGITCYYITPDGYDYQQVWYRSQTTEREGWLPVCCDDGTSVDGYDGWAGMYNEPMDRIQLFIGDYNPF